MSIINVPAPAGSQNIGMMRTLMFSNLGQALGAYLKQEREKEDLRKTLSMGQTQDIFNTMYGARGLQAPQPQMPAMGSQKFRDLQMQGLMQNLFQPQQPGFTLGPGQTRFGPQGRQIATVEPQKPTPSPIMKMVSEGLLTLPEGKELARKEKEGNLTEKDIISIMHTLERALASTYTVLNEPIGGEKYAKRRNNYAQLLDTYRKRLDQLRSEKTGAGEIDFTGPGAGGVPGWDAESLGLSGSTPNLSKENVIPITATNPKTGERIQSFDGGKTWQPIP